VHHRDQRLGDGGVVHADRAQHGACRGAVGSAFDEITAHEGSRLMMKKTAGMDRFRRRGGTPERGWLSLQEPVACRG
jgi:hypothetical protein